MTLEDARALERMRREIISANDVANDSGNSVERLKHIVAGLRVMKKHYDAEAGSEETKGDESPPVDCASLFPEFDHTHPAVHNFCSAIIKNHHQKRIREALLTPKGNVPGPSSVEGMAQMLQKEALNGLKGTSRNQTRYQLEKAAENMKTLVMMLKTFHLGDERMCHTVWIKGHSSLTSEIDFFYSTFYVISSNVDNIKRGDWFMLDTSQDRLWFRVSELSTQVHQYDVETEEISNDSIDKEFDILKFCGIAAKQ